LDVLRPPRDGGRHPLLDLPTLLVTPHIGGATLETLQRGAAMVAEGVRRHREGKLVIESQENIA
jgi:phosphoglycerate dehydrogenase-like enzyme